MKNDQDIIKACLTGDQFAYKHLYEKYISYVYSICLRYIVPKADQKDLVQIIFSQTFNALKNYDSSKSQFKTWLTRICINHILTYKKKHIKALQTISFENIQEADINHSANNIDEQMNKEHILSLLKKMPSNYQLVFNMFIIDGYSHEEISKELNITTSSSRVILNRARKWVKKTIVEKLIS